MPRSKESTGRKESSGSKYGKGASKSVESAMRRKNRGTLRSGPGGKGGKVKSRKQAIAIGLSEARKKGAKVPRKKRHRNFLMCCLCRIRSDEFESACYHIAAGLIPITRRRRSPSPSITRSTSPAKPPIQPGTTELCTERSQVDVAPLNRSRKRWTDRPEQDYCAVFSTSRRRAALPRNPRR